MAINYNELPGHGDLHTVFIAGRAAEYLKFGDLVTHIIELYKSTSIITDYENAVASIPAWETKHFPSVWAFRSFRILLYSLVRDMKPGIVVETGVLHGMTSGFILEALAQNGSGSLTSIDLPSLARTGPSNKDGYNDTLPENRKTGWLVPSRLKDRWDLRLGASIDVLPKVLESCSSIDMFIHDSEHSYETMWFELTAAWGSLREGGVLICDNVEANTAFYDFCRRVDRMPLVLPTPTEDRLHAPRFAIIAR